jgi:hypothetical protein
MNLIFPIISISRLNNNKYVIVYRDSSVAHYLDYNSEFAYRESHIASLAGAIKIVNKRYYGKLIIKHDNLVYTFLNTDFVNTFVFHDCKKC